MDSKPNRIAQFFYQTACTASVNAQSGALALARAALLRSLSVARD